MREGREVIESAQRALATSAKLEGATIVAFCADGSVYLLKKPEIKLPLDVAKMRRPRENIEGLMNALGVPNRRN